MVICGQVFVEVGIGAVRNCRTSSTGCGPPKVISERCRTNLDLSSFPPKLCRSWGICRSLLDGGDEPGNSLGDAVNQLLLPVCIYTLMSWVRRAVQVPCSTAAGDVTVVDVSMFLGDQCV